MGGGFWRVAEGPAHLCEALSIEPALADALFDGPAVGARFAAADMMKTLPKVDAEMALHVLAYNLTRVMNIVWIKSLMAAFRA